MRGKGQLMLDGKRRMVKRGEEWKESWLLCQKEQSRPGEAERIILISATLHLLLEPGVQVEIELYLFAIDM